MTCTQSTKALIASLLSASRIVSHAIAAAASIGDIYTDDHESAPSVARAQNLARLFALLSQDSGRAATGALWVDGALLGSVDVLIDGAVDLGEGVAVTSGSDYRLKLSSDVLLKLKAFVSAEGDVKLVVDDPDRFYEALLAAEANTEDDPVSEIEYGTREIIATFQSEDFNFRPVGDPEPIDVTSAVLACDLRVIHAMEDDTDSTNDLVTSRDVDFRDRPHRITVVEQICAFFEVVELEDIEQADLDAARAAHLVAAMQQG
ncbi:hypothetical protein [Paraburkholderia sp. J8-2]|uniref:hypothetical protein n=1 Tax=Paraburkholderia sp. J8-2 TaxID=2805440 RepID=UPI002AB77C87|nr:hypothetical protein [Paraburkholderia sp. J8-2]